MRRLGVLILAVSLAGCASYRLETAINEASFYRARYIERCVTKREPGVPCEAWVIEQRKLDQAVGEAADAMKVGGRQTLQAAALRRHLEAVRKEFGSWAK